MRHHELLPFAVRQRFQQLLVEAGEGKEPGIGKLALLGDGHHGLTVLAAKQFDPDAVAAVIAPDGLAQSRRPATAFPSTEGITSATRTPAFAAGPWAATEETR